MSSLPWPPPISPCFASAVRSPCSLIHHLGLDMKAMRIILEQSDRTSYQYIWNDVKLQIGNK
jgi:hypothetical protein